jgi:hypothetical protein
MVVGGSLVMLVTLTKYAASSQQVDRNMTITNLDYRVWWDLRSFWMLTLRNLVVSCWHFGATYRSHIQGLTIEYGSGRSSLCIVFSLTPSTGPILPLFLSSFLPYQGPETSLSRTRSVLIVWAVYTVKITCRTGCKILLQWIFRRGQRVPCLLHVLHLCYWRSIYVLFRERYIHFFVPRNQPEVLGLIS